jgi:hypothetical protein
VIAAGPGSPTGETLLGDEIEAQRRRLLELRAALGAERARAVSPAVRRALEQADIYLYLGLGYLGHCDDLFPEEQAPAKLTG